MAQAAQPGHRPQLLLAPGGAGRDPHIGRALTVAGTLIDAWASQKTFERKDGGTGGDGRDFRGKQRKNDTHVSKTDPDARLYRRSNHAESRLVYLGHLLMEIATG